MNNLVYDEKDENLKKLLYPMFQILDKKNIIKGITIKKENQRLYICLDRNCLSNSNQLILEKISYVYSNTLFYSNNNQTPNEDRLEYWCPDEDYDKRTHITERCRNKKMFVLELDSNDEFIILGTSIMLANALEEQDLLYLKVNEDMVVFESDVIERQKHYISSGYPDLRWISLNISLNKDNPLRENPYAPFISVCEINSPVSCDNMILATLVGYKEKIYKTFCMEKEELEKAIREYFERQNNDDELPCDLEIACELEEEYIQTMIETRLDRPENTEPCGKTFIIKEEEIFVNPNDRLYRYYQLCPHCGYIVNIPKEILSEEIKQRIEDRCSKDDKLFRKMFLYSELFSLDRLSTKGQKKVLKK